MAFGFEFPHTHNYDSDLREVLHYMKILETEYNNIENLYEEMKSTLDAMEAQYQEIIRYYHTIPTLIDNSVKESMDKYSKEIDQKLSDMAEEINNFSLTINALRVYLMEYTDSKVDGLMAQFRLELLRYVTALQTEINELKKKIEILPESLYVFCQPCGWQKPLQHTLNDIYNSAREPHGLTVAEYNSYGLSVSDYDTFQMTVIKYAMLGKDIINRFWKWHYNPITGIKNTVTNISSWLATYFFKTLSVSEYEALNLSVEDYEALNLTTFDYLTQNAHNGYLALGGNGLTVAQYATIYERI